MKGRSDDDAGEFEGDAKATPIHDLLIQLGGLERGRSQERPEDLEVVLLGEPEDPVRRALGRPHRARLGRRGSCERRRPPSARRACRCQASWHAPPDPVTRARSQRGCWGMTPSSPPRSAVERASTEGDARRGRATRTRQRATCGARRGRTVAGASPCATGRCERRESSRVRSLNLPESQGLALYWTVRFSAVCPEKSPRERFANGSPCGAILPPPPTEGGGAVNRSPARQLAGLRLESASVRGVLREGDVRGVIAERDAENADGRNDRPDRGRRCSLKGPSGRERQRAVNRSAPPRDAG